MLADELEPSARAIAALIVQSGAPISGAWNGYTADEDLIPLKQEEDDNLHFVRERDGSGRMELFGIKPVDPDPDTIVCHDPVVQKSDQKASASVEIDNLGGLTDQTYKFSKVFKTGENEGNAIEAGFSLTSKTKIGTGNASPYDFSQEFSATVSSAWKKQTGRSSGTETGGDFPLVALPHTKVRGFLAWEEQDLLRQIDCVGTWTFGVKIGRRKKSGRKRRWRWYSGYHQWASIDHIVATAEGRGSVHFPLHDFWGSSPPLEALIAPVRLRPQVSQTRFISYKGAAGIRVVISTIEDARPDDHGEAPEKEEDE